MFNSWVHTNDDVRDMSVLVTFEKVGIISSGARDGGNCTQVLGESQCLQRIPVAGDVVPGVIGPVRVDLFQSLPIS